MSVPPDSNDIQIVQWILTSFLAIVSGLFTILYRKVTNYFHRRDLIDTMQAIKFDAMVNALRNVNTGGFGERFYKNYIAEVKQKTEDEYFVNNNNK